MLSRPVAAELAKSCSPIGVTSEKANIKILFVLSVYSVLGMNDQKKKSVIGSLRSCALGYLGEKKKRLGIGNQNNMKRSRCLMCLDKKL